MKRSNTANEMFMKSHFEPNLNLRYFLEITIDRKIADASRRTRSNPFGAGRRSSWQAKRT